MHVLPRLCEAGNAQSRFSLFTQHADLNILLIDPRLPKQYINRELRAHYLQTSLPYMVLAVLYPADKGKKPEVLKKARSLTF